jgi:hypothetical protein
MNRAGDVKERDTWREQEETETQAPRPGFVVAWWTGGLAVARHGLALGAGRCWLHPLHARES